MEILHEGTTILEESAETNGNRTEEDIFIIMSEATILANLFGGLLNAISPKEREEFEIPDFIAKNGLRDALARQILKPSDLTTEELGHLSSARGITRWLHKRILSEELITNPEII